MESRSIQTIAAYIPYPWQHAVTMLRIVRPLQQAGIQVLSGSDPSQGVIRPELVTEADAVLIQREFPAYSGSAYDQILQLARAQHKAVIYETDDLLLELPSEHPDHAIHYYTYALLPMLQAILTADLVTTTSHPLQTYYENLNPQTILLPNYLDDLTWQPRQIHQELGKSPLTIGYMGSSTHTPDLESIAPVFVELADRYRDRIVFKFWGAAPPKSLLAQPNVHSIPLEILDYSEFARFFSEQDVDIFVAPLAASFFNQCKSPIKFYEYSILGIPGVFSRLEPYQTVIQDRQNGMLADTLDEWRAALVELIEDQNLRLQIGQSAQKCVIERYRISDHAHEWSQAYSEAVEQSRSLVNKPVLDERTRIFLRVGAQVQSWLEILHQQTIQSDQALQQLHAREIDGTRSLQETRAELERTLRQLDEIQESESWRIITSLDKLKRVLYPAGSARERAAQKVASWLLQQRPPDQE